jgi:hypothetical protein
MAGFLRSRPCVAFLGISAAWAVMISKREIGMIAEHEVGYASMDGTLAQCDRLCRVHRRGDVSQAAKREAARLTRVQRDALIG